MIDIYQFITFRTHDSLDDFLVKIDKEKISNKKKKYLVDKHLDISTKGAYLNGEVLDFMYKYLLENDKKFYNIISFCIMPNHVHLLIKQNEDLSKIIQKIKGSSANKINKLLKRDGKFWESNYFDKVIVDEKHFNLVYEYIKNNPIKANLKDGKRRFYGIYDLL